MLFMPYNITGHSLDCCMLNGRDIMAYNLVTCYDMTFYSSLRFTNN